MKKSFKITIENLPEDKMMTKEEFTLFIQSIFGIGLFLGLSAKNLWSLVGAFLCIIIIAIVIIQVNRREKS